MASELVRWALPFWLLLATVVLLPFGVGPEVPILIGAVAGAVALLRGRVDWQQPEVKLAVMLGLGYWLPEFVSAWDSLSPDKSWSEVGLDLRLVLFLIFIANHHWSQGEQRGLVQTIAVVACCGVSMPWCRRPRAGAWVVRLRPIGSAASLGRAISNLVACSRFWRRLPCGRAGIGAAGRCCCWSA